LKVSRLSSRRLRSLYLHKLEKSISCHVDFHIDVLTAIFQRYNEKPQLVAALGMSLVVTRFDMLLMLRMAFVLVS
jgi:hypothetical protein